MEDAFDGPSGGQSGSQFGHSAKTPDIAVGADLSTLSVEELDERIALLHAEIKRLEQERQKKNASLTAANAFFKS
ncbi:MAG: DUF1192 domain-containing protein [Pseudomonadota bacterium]